MFLYLENKEHDALSRIVNRSALRPDMNVKAVAYLRTSSATNVGEDKDSHKRQMAAINAFAKRAGYSIELPPYYDDAVSGADPIDRRPGFASMLAYLAENQDVHTILVESASRFARDLVLQLTGHDLLKSRGIALVPVDAPDHFTAETPTAIMVRQILGAVSQFSNARRWPSAPTCAPSCPALSLGSPLKAGKLTMSHNPHSSSADATANADSCICVRLSPQQMDTALRDLFSPARPDFLQ